jgi:hypothetical protein
MSSTCYPCYCAQSNKTELSRHRWHGRTLLCSQLSSKNSPLSCAMTLKTPNHRPIVLEEPARQYYRLDRENKANDRPPPNPSPVRWKLQLCATASSTHRDPRAWQQTQYVRPQQSHAKGPLSLKRHSCEDQTLAGRCRRSGIPQRGYHARLPPIRALRGKTAPPQPNPPRTRPSRKFWLVSFPSLLFNLGRLPWRQG